MKQKECLYMQAKENKIYSLFPISRQNPATSLQTRPQVHVVIALEDKCHNNECCCSSSFLFAFIAEEASYSMEYPFQVISLGQLS